MKKKRTKSAARRRMIGLDEHEQISRDMKTIEELASKLMMQFGTASRRTLGPYSSLIKIVRYADQARRRSSRVLKMDHRSATLQDIYGLWT
jgi:hypothetical protein